MGPLMVEFHLAKSGFQMVFQSIEAVEDAVVEGLLAQVVPKMLDRIEFRRVRRQFE